MQEPEGPAGPFLFVESYKDLKGWELQEPKELKGPLAPASAVPRVPFQLLCVCWMGS